MNKYELCLRISERAGIQMMSAESSIDAMIEIITESLAEGEKVQLMGFGTFDARSKPERMAVHPKTREQISVKPRRVPVFRPGKDLKNAVTGKK